MSANGLHSLHSSFSLSALAYLGFCEVGHSWLGRLLFTTTTTTTMTMTTTTTTRTTQSSLSSSTRHLSTTLNLHLIICSTEHSASHIYFMIIVMTDKPFDENICYSSSFWLVELIAAQGIIIMITALSGMSFVLSPRCSQLAERPFAVTLPSLWSPCWRTPAWLWFPASILKSP